MGIYIKGMEMPKGIEMLVVFSDGTVHKCLPGMREYVEKGTAVPLLSHGRLIESAELYGKAEDIKTKALSMCDKSQSWQFGVFWAIEQIKAALTNTPTIIPAEEAT